MDKVHLRGIPSDAWAHVWYDEVPVPEKFFKERLGGHFIERGGENVKKRWEKFEIGDKVKYIGDSISGHFQKGSVYTVSNNYPQKDNEFISVSELEESSHEHSEYASNFIKQNKGEAKMNQDILKEFGDEKGTTLVNVSKHLNDAMRNRIINKAYHKEIVKACNDEAKRLEAEENDK